MRSFSNLLFFSFLFLLHFLGNTQPTLFFKGLTPMPSYTAYGSSASVDTLSQNSFICGGRHTSFPNLIEPSTHDSYLLKNEINGLTKWFKKYHLQGASIGFNDIKIDKNKDILICGSSVTLNGTYNNGILIKTDSNGIIKWAKQYPHQELFSTRPLKNGDIAVFATDSTQKIKLCLLDINGNVKWCKKQMSNFGNTFYGCRITEGKNKDLLFYGYDGRAFAILTDSMGNNKKNLNMTNPVALTTIFYSCISFLNNGYYMCGVGQGASNLFTGNVLRLDNSLNILWHKNLSLSNHVAEFFDIAAYNSNSFVLLTEPEDDGSHLGGLKRMGLTFIDSVGTVRKSLLFTTDSVNYLPFNFFLLNNGRVLFNGIGHTDTVTGGMNGCFGITDTIANGFCGFDPVSFVNANTSQNFLFNNYTFINSSLNSSAISLHMYKPDDLDIKYMCSSGPVGPYDPIDVGIEEEEDEHDFLKLFPNPANESLVIMNVEHEKRFLLINSKIRITNTFGITVLEADWRQGNSYTLNTKDLKEGMYFLSLQLANSETILKKFIVKH